MKVRKHFPMKWVSFFALFALILSIGVLHGVAAAESNNMVVRQELDDEQVYEYVVEEEAGGISVEAALSSGEEPVLDIDMPKSINIGESLTITVNNAENVTLKTVRVMSNSISMGSTAFTGNTAIIPDYCFDLGRNTITIQGNDLNTNESFSIQRTIQVLGASPVNGPVISSDKDIADFGESVTFTISMPGAERFAYQTLSYIGSQLKSYSSMLCKTADDQTTVNRISYYGNSRMVFRAKAYVNGAWTAYSEYEVSINEAPKLDTPEYTAPSLVLVNTPIELTIQPVEHAEKYRVAIYQNGSGLGGHTYDAAGTYVLDYQPPVGSYRIAVYAEAAGYETSDYSWSDLEIVSEIIDGPEISSDENPLSIRRNAIFTMTLQGATQFRCYPIILQNGVVENPDHGYYIYDAVDGSAQYSIYVFDEYAGAIFEMHAQARINNQWTKETVLRVPVKMVPRLDTPSITVSSSSVEAGTPVYVTIGAVQNADEYYIHVKPETNPSIEYSYRSYEAGTCELQGLAEPGDYTISVTAYASGSDYTISMPAIASVKLVGTPEDGPYLSSRSPWVKPEEYISVFAWLNDAERFYITTTVYRDDGRISQLGYLPNSFIANDGTGFYSLRVGTYHWNAITDYHIYVSASRNGKWTRPSMSQVAVNGTDHPVLETYDFILPSDLITIDASAFESINTRSIYIPDSCTSIGAHAFSDNVIYQLRLPRSCAIDGTAFDDSDLFAIVAPAGGSSEAWAQEYVSTHDYCTYYPE